MLYILYNNIFSELSMFFSVTMSSNVTDVWQCNHDVTLTLTLDPNKENKSKKKTKKKLNKKN